MTLAPTTTPASSPPRPPEPDAPRTEPRAHPRKTYQALLTGLGILVLLAVCGLSSWFIVIDETKGTDARDAVTPGPTAVPRDITSRQADAKPLTEKEVFPQREIVINPVEPPYKVLKTSASKDCRTAAAGEVAKLLNDLGCNQVVRGTLRSPTGAYLVTGGIFNLEEKAGAEFAREKIRPFVNGGKGRFNGMVAGKGTEPIALSSAHVGWDIRGHYLIYCVIARADGKDFADADPYARQILFDIVEMHLRDKVLEQRATIIIGPGTPAPAS